MTLQHVVLFSFPWELSERDVADMKAQVASWPKEIGGFNKLRLGSALSTERTRGYTWLLYMEFDSMDGLHSYRAHPVHQVFNKWLMDRECTPLAFDFFLDETTVLMPETG